MRGTRSDGAARRRRRVAVWIEVVAELVMIGASCWYVIAGDLTALFAWEGVAVAYLLLVFGTAWSGERRPPATREEAGFVERWNWLLPLLSSVVGAYSAVVALGARADLARGVDSAVLAGAASLGVVLSWMLLQVGFAHVYEALAHRDGRTRAIDIPGTNAPSVLDHLYFSFVIGTSFATSDASIRGVRVRRTVLVQSVVCFFYNALVVAVAFQVLQQLVG
ncbi:putative membrane protein [Pseudoclavibacter chungangensis]|nr:DUF1345 domain-containing protein [Pseudoclavibacter chungangensis]NYJ66043.1 putative membrane protein [Pseudoclavibacter chungangensis]